MTKFAKLIMVIAMLGSVTISLVFASYAWITKSEHANTDGSGMDAEESARIKVIGYDEQMDMLIEEYRGELGNTPFGTEDAPYTITRRFDVGMHAITDATRFKIEFMNLSITMRDGTVMHLESDTEYANFTWRLTLTDGRGAETLYYPDSEGFAREKNGYNGTNDGEYLYVQNGEYDFTLSVIFLSESDYKYWEGGDYEAITPFAYSDYAYMRSKFSIAVNLIVDGDTAVVDMGGVSE